MNTKQMTILLPTMIGGELMVEGDRVEVSAREAHDLEARGRATPYKPKESAADGAAGRQQRGKQA